MATLNQLRIDAEVAASIALVTALDKVNIFVTYGCGNSSAWRIKRFLDQNSAQTWATWYRSCDARNWATCNTDMVHYND